MARVISLRSLCILFNLALALPYNDYSQEMNQRSDQPIVTIRNGSYYGIHSSNYKQDFFLGIPFAQPPVGDLRLQPPASLNTSWAGLRNATEYSPACYGYGEDTFIGALNYCSEDCLTLNVVRPSGYEQEKLPVGVWIYGLVYILVFSGQVLTLL
jgi:carboxylesterase type B